MFTSKAPITNSEYNQYKKHLQSKEPDSWIKTITLIKTSVAQNQKDWIQFVIKTLSTFSSLAYIKKGDPTGNSSFYIGVCYQMGLGELKQNDKKAFDYFVNAKHKGCPLSFLQIGRYYFQENKFLKRDNKTAFKYFEKARKKEPLSPCPQLYLAICYNEGLGVEKDLEKCLDCCTQAMNLGSAEVADWLGDYYYEKNSKKALACFQKAVQLDDKNPSFLYNLAMRYSEGELKNPKKAFEYMQKAAKLNFAPALCELGIYYLNSTGTEKDWQKTFSCFEQATKAAPEDIQAFICLADCYKCGVGIKKDDKKALKLFKKAVEIDPKDKKAIKRLKEHKRDCSSKGVQLIKKENKTTIQKNKHFCC